MCLCCGDVVEWVVWGCVDWCFREVEVVCLIVDFEFVEVDFEIERECFVEFVGEWYIDVFDVDFDWCLYWEEMWCGYVGD